MALEKQSVIDQIEITRDGHVQVRRANLIVEDGKEIAKTYHRHVLAPGDSTEGEDVKVIAHCTVAWTPEVISAYKTKLANVKKVGL